ncbi:MAG: MFS transporter, partial [Chloroflexi bacterium]|nr:MFS transporter [Chloroflexota bacterium]
DGAASLYTISVLFGLGLGAEMTAFPIINRQFYGAGAPLNSVHAWEIVGALVGMGIGGWLGGVLFDMSGSYATSTLMGGLATLAALPVIMALPGKSARLPIVAAAPSAR